VQASGLTQGSIRQIERARHATMLLQEGVSILDAVEMAGYADQAHLTRALKYFIGKTPAQIINKSEPEQMSLLFKTEPSP
jgi:methylphosphotriester-DNA--protein-cysteine methyltransferase